MNKPLTAAIAAFSSWGLFPLYWKMFLEVPAVDLFLYRLFFSFITLAVFILIKKRMGVIKEIFKDKRKFFWLSISALLISSNWLIYIYAVSINRVLEASMGYFLNPIIIIILGRLIFQEKMRLSQIPSVALVIGAITYIAFNTDISHFPWIALSLSLSFALYGLIRKLVKIGSLEGLFFETMMVCIPAMIIWPTINASPLQTFLNLGLGKGFLLSLSGLITGLPLILFAYAAKNLKFTTLGFTQYFSPSLKFLCGLFIFKETLLPQNLVGFALIWTSLILYSLESLYFSGKSRLMNRNNL